ncbi:MAG TPA: hypothetical protein VGI86_22380, partial [Acidimicrobiia bacterium]
MPRNADEARWSAVLARITGEIDQRDVLIAEGRLRTLRAPSMDVPDDLGPVPKSLVPDVHALLERLAAQQAVIERELTAVGREIARSAAARHGG